MTATEIRFTPPTARSGSVAKNKWSWPHYLSLIGVPILVLDLWTMVSWIADGPTQVTEFRDTGSMSWWACRFLEAVVILGSVPVIVHLVRDCRRKRRFLTLDVMFCIACAMMTWLDQQPAMIAPTWLPSSNFINLTSTCGHTPLVVVNPDCGRAIDPILFDFFLEAFCILGVALLIGRYIRRLRAKRPDISNLRIFCYVVLWGWFTDFLLEGVVAVPFHAWNFAPVPSSIPMGGGFHYPIVELIDAGSWFGLFAAVYLFRNDKGETIAERGLERHSPGVRKGLTLMSLYTLIQVITIALGNGPLTITGLYETQWPKMPVHIVNNVCDAPGIHGTRYGSCPGSPSFRLPLRHSLPGESP